MSDLTRAGVINLIAMAQHGLNLRGVNLADLNLNNLDFTRANLDKANLDGAVLSGALMQGAKMVDAGLFAADLTETDLCEANLTKANLATYSTTFIQNYLYAIIYPVNLTKDLQINLGISLIVLNAVIYGVVVIKYKKN